MKKKEKKECIRAEDNDFSRVDDRYPAHYCLPGTRRATSVQQTLASALDREGYKHLKHLIRFGVVKIEMDGKVKGRVYLFSRDETQLTHIEAKEKWDAAKEAKRNHTIEGDRKRKRESREEPQTYGSNLRRQGDYHNVPSHPLTVVTIHGNVYGNVSVPQQPRGGGNPVPPQKRPRLPVGETPPRQHQLIAPRPTPCYNPYLPDFFRNPPPVQAPLPLSSQTWMDLFAMNEEEQRPQEGRTVFKGDDIPEEFGVHYYVQPHESTPPEPTPRYIQPLEPTPSFVQRVEAPRERQIQEPLPPLAEVLQGVPMRRDRANAEPLTEQGYWAQFTITQGKGQGGQSK